MIDRVVQLPEGDPAQPSRLRRISRLGFALVVGASFCSRLVLAGATPAILLVPEQSPRAALEVHGLAARVVAELRRIPNDDPRWPQVFGLRVGAADSNASPPMLGSYEVTGDVVRFKPRFPLERGIEYRAVFHWRGTPGAPATGVRIAKSLRIPAAAAGPPTRVTAIFPSSAELPENVLRLYVQFSAPMSQGNSYGYVHLRDDRGTEIDRPFLELPQELWSPDGTRLTLLFEPGRIKRGLVPRTEQGPILIAGRKYTLTIDGKWPDAEGRPLRESVHKTFRAVSAEATQPDLRAWKVDPPAPGSRDPLVVHFPKPLDRAMLERVLRVCRIGTGKASAGRLEDVAGIVEVADGETCWSFTPRDHWAAGRYALVVSTVLEDRAGNSIRLTFEVDLNRPQPAKPTPAVVRVEFTVRGRP